MSIYEIWEDDIEERPTYRLTRSGEQVGPTVHCKQAVARLIHHQTGRSWRATAIVDRTTVAPHIDELLRPLDDEPRTP